MVCHRELYNLSQKLHKGRKDTKKVDKWDMTNCKYTNCTMTEVDDADGYILRYLSEMKNTV
jgi:rRNA-processing protein FCF1